MIKETLEERINEALKGDTPFKNISLFWFEQLDLLDLFDAVDRLLSNYEYTDDSDCCVVEGNDINELDNIYRKLIDGPQQG